MSGAPTRSIPALQRGALLDLQTHSFEVLGIYEPAVNLRSHTGAVWSVVAAAEHMTAYSLLVATPFWRCADARSVGPARAEAGVLFLADVALAYAQASLWDGRISARAAPDREAALAVREALLNDASAVAGGFATLLSTARGDPFTTRARAILETGRLEELVGLGPGLTPAGDDFLCGVLAVAAPLVDSGAVRTRLPHTTAPGQALLSAALQGHFPAYLKEIAAIIGGPTMISAATAARVVDRARRHGASSGIDALSGLLWALLRAPRADQ